MSLITYLEEEAKDMGVAPINAKHILVKEKKLTQVSVKEYAKEKEISEAKARYTLNKMCEKGNALVDSNVIIDTATRKKGSRNETRYVRGNLYTFINN